MGNIDAAELSELNLNSPVAQIVFDDSVPPERQARDRFLLDAFTAWLCRATPGAALNNCQVIDRAIVPQLTAPGLLEMAQLIAGKYPQLMAAMPQLSGHMEVLAVAERAGAVFKKSNLDSLRAALIKEGDL